MEIWIVIVLCALYVGVLALFKKWQLEDEEK